MTPDKILSKLAEIRKKWGKELEDILSSRLGYGSEARIIDEKLVILSALEKMVNFFDNQECGCFIGNARIVGYSAKIVTCENCLTLESIWKEVKNL